MKNLLFVLVLLFPMLALAAPPPPILRQALTTNAAIGTFTNGQVPTWNGTAWAPSNGSAITLAQVTNIASGALTNGNLIYVDQIVGSDVLGRRWNFAWPRLTSTGAVAVALAGDTIQVRPGSYAGNNLLKNGVNWQGLPGAILTYTDPGSGAGYGIFDDRSVSGGCTSIISGFEIVWSTGYGAFNVNCKGAVTTTHSNTVLTLDNMTLRGYSDVTNALGTSLLHVEDARRVRFKGHTIESTVPGSGTCNIQGVYWVQGYLNVDCSTIRMDTGLGVWGENIGNPQRPADMHVRCDIISVATNGSPLYLSGGFTNNAWRAWIHANEVIKTNAVDATLLLQNYSGKGYFVFDKISGGSVTIQVGDGGAKLAENWIDAQKLTFSGLGYHSRSAGTRTILHINEWQDLGPVTTAIDNEAGFTEISSGTVNSQAGYGAFHWGGALTLRNVTLRNTNGYPAFTLAGGLTFDNCTLASMSVTNCIQATNAQTVKVYGSLSASTNLSPNVTIPFGVVEVHGGVQ